MSITEPEFRELLDRYLRGVASPEEQRMLDAFFDSYKKELAQEDPLIIDETIRNEILELMRERLPLHRRPAIARPVWLAMAAVISISLVAYLFLVNPDTGIDPVQVTHALVTETTTRGQKSVIDLSDGTKVYLNSNSSLLFKNPFQGETREVELMGEAFFEVAHDASKPFVVRANGVRTRVQGTAFNIRSQKDGTIQITLVSGKISVQGTGDEAALRPGQQAVIHTTTGDMLTREVDVGTYIGWKDNSIIFEGVTPTEAADILGDWYDVDISIPAGSLTSCRITATYNNESLGNVLQSLEFLLHAKVTYKDSKTIILDGEGCK